MYNLIEFVSNYSDATGSFYLYSKNMATSFDGYIANNNSFKSFNHKGKL